MVQWGHEGEVHIGDGGAVPLVEISKKLNAGAANVFAEVVLTPGAD